MTTTNEMLELTELETRLLVEITEHPNGIRLCDLGSSLRTWHIHLLPAITSLENKSLIYSVEYKDIGNMENYLLYKRK